MRTQTLKDDEQVMGVAQTYGTIRKVLALKHVRSLILVLLTCKFAFAAHEVATGLKLLEKGLKREDMALAVLVDFPLEIVFGLAAARWSQGSKPLRPWLRAYYLRIITPLFIVALLHFMPATAPGGALPTRWYAMVLLGTAVSSFTATVQFVSAGAFFAKISDPAIGGTYMTVSAYTS